MGLSVWTNPTNTTPEPLPIARPEQGHLLLVPRHLTESSVTLAMEWWEYEQTHQDGLRDGDAATDAESMRRWEDYVEAVSPTFTSRADAVAFLARLTHAINATWPVA